MCEGRDNPLVGQAISVRVEGLIEILWNSGRGEVPVRHGDSREEVIRDQGFFAYRARPRGIAANLVHNN